MENLLKCPCEECISFAICYQQTTIKCPELYSFVCETYINGRGFKVYGGHREQERLIVKKLFNREVSSTLLPTREVSFIHEPIWGT